MYIGAAAHVAIALRDLVGQCVEIEPVAQQPLALEFREAGVALGDAARQEVGELRLAQVRPIAGVVGDEHLAGEAPKAKESQIVGGEIGRRDAQAALLHYPSSSNAAWRRRVMVSYST